MGDARDQREPMVHVTARVPATLAQAIEELAAAEDRSVSAEMRRAMRAHVGDRHPPTTEAARVKRAG